MPSALTIKAVNTCGSTPRSSITIKNNNDFWWKLSEKTKNCRNSWPGWVYISLKKILVNSKNALQGVNFIKIEPRKRFYLLNILSRSETEKSVRCRIPWSMRSFNECWVIKVEMGIISLNKISFLRWLKLSEPNISERWKNALWFRKWKIPTKKSFLKRKGSKSSRKWNWGLNIA